MCFFRLKIRQQCIVYIAMIISQFSQSHAAIVQKSLRSSPCDPKFAISKSTADNPTIWDMVTGRNTTFYQSVLTKNPASPFNDAPAFNYEDFLSGRKSVLSLGEGNATFIFDILIYQKATGKINKTAFAFDAKNPANFNNHQDLFPANYMNGFFQELNLIDTDTNSRATFDEIISVYSLNFVANGSSEEELITIMARIMDHLKIGGVLRVYPTAQLSFENIQKALTKVTQITGMQFTLWFDYGPTTNQSFQLTVQRLN
jgi:hypothetical protein